MKTVFLVLALCALIGCSKSTAIAPKDSPKIFLDAAHDAGMLKGLCDSLVYFEDSPLKNATSAVCVDRKFHQQGTLSSVPPQAEK